MAWASIGMDIDLIETFIDIMETRSFNRTAERLQVTQSTVSHRVRSLEASLGKPLLVRGRGGAAPTQAGVRFHEHALMLRRQWREAVRQTR
ncbi:MAG: LysR family transcriptional regulator, partial [Rhodobacteraceae bacterium]|nr:LysR family transcriptional regulator [Paracoccaceae bacterium]